MKKPVIMAALVIIALVLLAIFAPSVTKKIDIVTHAYMYTEDGKIGKHVKTELHGSFNKDDIYQGTLKIGGTEFARILFFPVGGLVSYDGSEREVLGPIYYDRERNQYALIITSGKIYERLTGEKQGDLPLVVVTNAGGLKEAKRQVEAIQDQALNAWEAKLLK